MENKYVYFIGNTMYINVTNLCTSECVFCIRNSEEGLGDFNPWLDTEIVKAECVIDEVRTGNPCVRDEVVFCGYGEPFIKLDLVKEVAAFIKNLCPEVPIRVNTNGHASLIHKKDVVPELKGLIDRVSVSLNAENAELYKELTQTKFDAQESYEAMKIFMKDCQLAGIDTTASIVVGYKNYSVDVEKCKNIADSLGVNFKIREWLEEGYN